MQESCSLNLAGAFSAQSSGGAAPEAVPQQRPAWLRDISREIEVMRHVILQESTRLREQYTAQKEAVADLKAKLGICGRLPRSPRGAASTGPAPSCGGQNWRRALEAEALDPLPLSPVPRILPCRAVEWRIVGLEAERAIELEQRDHSTFDLPEYPEVLFAFSFGARRGGRSATASNGAEPSSSCRLKLQISGAGCVDLALQVGLDVELEADASDSVGDAAPDSTCLGRRQAVLLRGGGRVVCPCSWPPASQAASAVVVCRARVEFAGFLSCGLEPIRMVTRCQKPSAEAWS